MKNKRIISAIVALGLCACIDAMQKPSKYINEGLYKPLSLAEVIKTSDTATIGKLIDKGVSADLFLPVAAYYENVEIIEFLLKEGADPNFKDEYGNTALHYTIKQATEKLNKNQAKIVKLLLEYAANPFGQNKNQESIMKDAILPQHTLSKIGNDAKNNFTVKSKF